MANPKWVGWEEGKRRDFKCKLCGSRPPEAHYNHFRSSTTCADCLCVIEFYGVLMVLMGVPLLAYFLFGR